MLGSQSFFPSLGNLAQLSPFESRSICSENRDGSRSGGGRAQLPLDENGKPTGAARELGQGWKVKPCDIIKSGETFEMASIDGPGVIRHIWLTAAGPGNNRSRILRIYYDNQEHPAVECPLGDFFASAYTSFNEYAPLSSLPVCVNPGNAFNCYWPIPFHKRIRITVENRDPKDDMVLFFQVDYALGPIPEDSAYFCAQFRRTNPLSYGDVYTIVDGINGRGHFVGCSMAWQLNNDNWWGEGEIKFYLDGDGNPELSDGKKVGGHYGFPTICGTGTEDYFCGSYNFEDKKKKEYQTFNTPYAGVNQIRHSDNLYKPNMRFSMYRWHITDPIHFRKELSVTMQALGWRSHGRYLPLQDDISSVAYWYQTLPTAPFTELPDEDYLEII